MAAERKPKVDWASLDLATLRERAFGAEPNLNKSLAIDELAKRAIQKSELHSLACEAISAERNLPARGPFSLGWPGGVAILSSDQPEFVAMFLQSMSNWPATEKHDMLRFFAGKDGLDSYVAELENTYGWTAA